MAMSLSNEQQKALDSFQKGNNLCVIGPGGSGKSFLIQTMYEDAIKRGKQIHVTALTGCAAFLLVQAKARTIHSWSGVYRYQEKEITPRLIESYVKLIHKKRQQSMSRWLTADILIIDEISMMSARFFTLLDGIAKELRSQGFHDDSYRQKPFGGIQVVVVGDFLQIPPVIKDEREGCIKHRIPIFECDAWRSMIRKRSQVIVMKKNFRAQQDVEWANILNTLRQGSCPPHIQKALENRLISIPSVKAQMEANEVKPTVLVSTHLQVDAMNIANLKQCPEESEKTWYATPTRKDIETRDEITIEPSEMSYHEKEAWKDAIGDSLMQKELVLRKGAQVMCIYNVDVQKGLVNGARGVVKRYDETKGYPIVFMQSIQKEIMITPVLIPTRIPNFYISQIPLCQAWAITIHKSQGQTLDCAEVDIGSSVFVPGQAYVALSRVRSLNDVYIRNFSVRSIWGDSFAKRFCAAVGDV